MDPVSIIGLISFAGGCTNILHHAVKTVHQAPNEILSLYNEVTDLRLVLVEYHAMRNATPSAEPTTATFDNTFECCLVKVRDLFSELANLTATLFSVGSDGRQHFERCTWLRKKASAVRLKQDLSNVRQNLRDLIGINSESKLNRIELRLNSLDGLLAQMAPPTAQADLVAPAGVTFTAYTRLQCSLQCTCTCHFRYRLRTPPVIKTLLGQIFVGYVGLPAVTAPCSKTSCATSEARSLRVTYTFPSWFIRKNIDLVVGSNFYGEPEFNVKIRNRREYSSEHSMFQLARNGKLVEMKQRLSNRLASPNDISAYGGSTAFDWALQYATATQDIQPCQLLIQSGADLDIENDYGATDAMSASQLVFTTKNRDLREGLTSLLSQIDLPSLWNFAHMHKVVLEILPLNISEEVKKLAHYSHINLVDIQNRTALHWAALRGNVEAIRALLLAGIDQHMLDVGGHSALHFAVISGNKECVETLLISGAQIHVKDKRGDNAILISAWASDNPGIIEALVSAGLDIMCRNVGDVTPLQSAAALNHAENVRKFVELGADIDAFDRNGDTALFETVYYNCVESLKVLSGHQIDYSHINNNGWTILHVLALYGTAEAIEIIGPHIHNVDVKRRDCRGRTALEALSDRLQTDAQVDSALVTLYTKLEELDDDASVDSFESALEMQVLSGVI